ncbi:MAG TPA: phosphoribosyltransferase family protein, partial [Bacteroidales bacterium]|nr:phosphoribosyltransferase family protein [Bacteroidales bacterium]
LVVGIPRSGLIPASIIALQLNKPFQPLDSFLSQKDPYSGERMRKALKKLQDSKERRILVVDDSTNSGHELRKRKKQIEEANLEGHFYFLCVYGSKESFHLPDICLELVETPRIFQWNIMNHKYLENSCLDLDGVLCVDPKHEQNDDGEKYRDFILNARPLFIPYFKLGHIVTSRLEKYRKETEIWLKSNGIEYGQLHMMQYETAEERRKDNKYGEYKAKIFINTKSILFIESEKRQAHTIHKLAQKPVFCTGTTEFFPSHVVDADDAVKPKIDLKQQSYFMVLRIKNLPNRFRALKRKIRNRIN